MNGIEAGKAYVKFLLEDKEFKKSLAAVGTKLQNIGKIGAAASAPIAGAFAAATAAFISAGDQLDKMSARTGFTVESLSELSYAAGQSGTSIGAIEKAAKKMQVGIVDAAGGTGTLFDALGTLGVSLESLQQQSPEQQFLTLSRAIGGIEDPTLKAAIAQKVFGKSGTELLPLLNSGAEGMDALRQRAHDLGLTIDTETATAAAVLGDNLDDVKGQVYAMGVQIGAAVAGPLTAFLQAVQPILGSVISWIKENPRLVATIGAVSTAVLATSTAVFGLGVALTILSAHPIVAVLTIISALVAGIVAYFWDWTAATDDVSKSLDKVTGKIPGVGAGQKIDAKAIKADAEAFQKRIEASSAAVTAAAVAPASAGLDSRIFQHIDDGIQSLIGIQQQMLNVVRTGRGGLVAGYN